MSAAKKLEPTVWLTTGEVAEMLRETPKTIRRWVRKGYLVGGNEPGCNIKIAKSSVDAMQERWKTRNM